MQSSEKAEVRFRLVSSHGIVPLSEALVQTHQLFWLSYSLSSCSLLYCQQIFSSMASSDAKISTSSLISLKATVSYFYEHYLQRAYFWALGSLADLSSLVRISAASIRQAPTTVIAMPVSTKRNSKAIAGSIRDHIARNLL
jgi:hypothetical protein